MEAIARTAQVSKKTIYARFASREHLLRSAVEHGFARHAISISSPRPRQSPQSALIALLAELLERSLSAEAIEFERLLSWTRDHVPDLGAALTKRANEMTLRPLAALLSQWKLTSPIVGGDSEQLATIVFDACVVGPRLRVLCGVDVDSAKSRRARIELVVALLFRH